MSNNFKIRQAIIDDVPLILSFIKELAKHEKLLNELVVTKEILCESLFGDKSYAEVIIGTIDDKPVSFAIYFHNFSDVLGIPGIYLEDLFVSVEARGQGIGEKMLAYLAALAKQRNCRRMEWLVADSNEKAIRFYKKLGAKPIDEYTLYRMTGEALDQLASLAEK